MTTDRPYRPAMTLDQAVAELRAKAGSQFNPAAVVALLRVLGATPHEAVAGARRPGIHAVPVPASE
jgi:HD-GYP domain-containing protein (c-di-GMP phosphodiesterase class II)